MPRSCGVEVGLGPGLLTEATRAAGRGSGSPHLVGDMQLRAQSRLSGTDGRTSVWSARKRLGWLGRQQLLCSEAFPPALQGCCGAYTWSGVIAEETPGVSGTQWQQRPTLPTCSPSRRGQECLQTRLSGGESGSGGVGTGDVGKQPGPAGEDWASRPRAGCWGA